MFASHKHFASIFFFDELLKSESIKQLHLMSLKSPFLHLLFGNTAVLESALVTFIA